MQITFLDFSNIDNVLTAKNNGSWRMTVMEMLTVVFLLIYGLST